MICKNCEKQIVLHAFSSSNCGVCNIEISTPHISSYRVCSKCAEENNLCESCGNKIQYFRFVYKDENGELGYTIVKADEREQAITIFENKFPSLKWYRTDKL